tara:strand:- start:28173 stop:29660 length:1488 start_codon:yes stop_codon:yes gene_type:complete
MKYSRIVLLLISFPLVLNSQELKLSVDSTVTTDHSTIILGEEIEYSATTGTQPLWDQDGKIVASLFYTYYERKNVKNREERPLVISFNGGPGSASVWMHIAYTGPKILTIDEEGHPIQPYGVKDNSNSILDIADIVYVNPVNTGYSRTIPASGKEVKKENFFGINADIKYLADWLNTFVTRNNRWLSPKYLIGESYGGTRVSGLALELQNRQWMYLNGVIMVSPADYKTMYSDPAVSTAINLPYFTATAWYHKQLSEELQSKELGEILPEVETYAINEYMPALAKGGFIHPAERIEIAKKIAYYSGLSEKVILQQNLEVPTSFFWKELLRDKSGMTIGRLDSRYLGIDKTETGSRPDYSPELTSWLHSFTPAINYYLREELDYKTDIKYNMFGDVHPWDKKNNNTRDNLRQAMAQNPYLKVLYQTGLYDGATTYFMSKYSMWQIDPSGKMKDRFTFKTYESGHMMYLRKADLVTASEDLREFILSSFKKGVPAKY